MTTDSSPQRRVDLGQIGGRRVRIVEGKGGPAAEVSVADGVRTLTLSGDPDQLPAAARALGSDLLPLADSTAVDKLVLTGDKSAELVQTFTTLGETVPTLKGIGQSQLDIPVLQSDFGTAISSLNIHLVGAYTPIPPELSAMLTYYWNNNLVESRTLDGEFRAKPAPPSRHHY